MKDSSALVPSSRSSRGVSQSKWIGPGAAGVGVIMSARTCELLVAFRESASATMLIPRMAAKMTARKA